MEKINAIFAKLPFKGLAEKFIPAGARAKVPLLETFVIRFANQIAVALIAVLLVACIPGGGGGARSGNIRQSDFNGTWNYGSMTYTISDREITYRFYGAGWDYYRTHRIDSVTPMTNTSAQASANYPTGFRFDTTLTGFGGNYRHPPTIGENSSLTFFMHTAKREFRIGNAIFKKQ